MCVCGCVCVRVCVCVRERALSTDTHKSKGIKQQVHEKIVIKCHKLQNQQEKLKHSRKTCKNQAPPDSRPVASKDAAWLLIAWGSTTKDVEKLPCVDYFPKEPALF